MNKNLKKCQIEKPKEKIIFLGNGKLADYSLRVLEKHCEVIFHAQKQADLTEVVRLKNEFPEAHGILASFGILIPEKVLTMFEPEGILNIHPSLLPRYRGASPIESAILDGAKDFSVSVMKLNKKMDAGPIYYQTTLKGLPLEKEAIYRALAETGTKWVIEHGKNLPNPAKQDESRATYTSKLTKEMGAVDFTQETAEAIVRKTVAFAGYPKTKCTIFGTKCTILKAHELNHGEKAKLVIPCAENTNLVIENLQPDGRKAMDAQGFLNGYKNK